MDVTDYLAIYGALLSSAVFLWTVQKSRPKIEIKLVFATDKVGKKIQHGLGVSVQNPSSHTVHISNLSFLYQYKNATIRDRLAHLIRFKRLPTTVGWVFSAFSYRKIEDWCPVAIEPGKSHWVFVPDEKLQDLLSDAITPVVRVVVQDALWRNKYSAKFTYKTSKVKSGSDS